MNKRIFVPALFSLVLVSLFLPFVKYEAFGFELFTRTGFQLAYELDSVIFIQVLALAALAGIILSLMGNKSTASIITFSGAVGLVSLGIYMFSIISKTPDPYIGSNIVLEYGSYLAFIAILAATLLSFINLQSPSSKGSVNPGRMVPGAGPLGRATPQGRPYGSESSNINQQVNTPYESRGYHPQTSPVHHAMPPAGYQSPTAAAQRNVPQHYQQVVTGPASGNPKLVGISGQYAGQKIDLGSGPVTIGRDPSIANLVYMQTKQEVSRKHCTISYDFNRHSFTIIDSSTNGTYLLPHQRIIQGKPVQIYSGSRFFISDPNEQFEVRFE